MKFRIKVLPVQQVPVPSVHSTGTGGMYLISPVVAEHECTVFVFCMMSQVFSSWRFFEVQLRACYSDRKECTHTCTSVTCPW